MDRRDTIKTMLLGGVAGAAVLHGCNTTTSERSPSIGSGSTIGDYGRLPEEAARDRELQKMKCFDREQWSTIAILCDIILPADDKSGAASDAGVADFIEFIAKDMPQHELPIKGGLMWLNHEANRRFGQIFADCSQTEQIAIVDDIAYPDRVDQAFSQGARFFSLMRDLTLTGFYTTRMGIDDLGYVGNTPNTWDGVPEEVLQRLGLQYEPQWVEKCINQSTRNELPVWDEDGNLIG